MIEPASSPKAIAELALSAGLGLWWRDALLPTIEHSEYADPLRAAAIAGRLKEWTRHLTRAVVASCETLGLQAAAKGHSLSLLPKEGQEYLGLDVTAFLPRVAGAAAWPFPLAAFELENSRSDDRIAYSLWKVASVRAPLGVVFAYRPTWAAAIGLVGTLAKAVPEGYGPGWGVAADGELVLVMGSRSRDEGFPWGYFKFWSFNRNVRAFEKL